MVRRLIHSYGSVYLQQWIVLFGAMDYFAESKGLFCERQGIAFLKVKCLFLANKGCGNRCRTKSPVAGMAVTEFVTFSAGV